MVATIPIGMVKRLAKCNPAARFDGRAKSDKEIKETSSPIMGYMS